MHDISTQNRILRIRYNTVQTAIFTAVLQKTAVHCSVVKNSYVRPTSELNRCICARQHDRKLIQRHWAPRAGSAAKE